MGKKWQGAAEAFRNNNGITLQERLWREGRQLRGFPDTEAKTDLLECVYSYIMKKHAEVPLADCIVDVGESHGRLLRGGKAEFRKMPLLSSATEVYAYGLDRSLVAEDTYSFISTHCYLLPTAGRLLLPTRRFDDLPCLTTNDKTTNGQ